MYTTIINGYVYNDVHTYFRAMRAFDNDNTWTKEAKDKLREEIFND